MASKTPVRDDNNFSNYLDERSINSIFLDPVTENEVFEIRKLNEHKSCGHDEIPPKLVKKISKYVTKPLRTTCHF